jgi:hypothetical protein
LFRKSDEHAAGAVGLADDEWVLEAGAPLKRGPVPSKVVTGMCSAERGETVHQLIAEGGTEKLNPSFNEGVVAVGGFTARSLCRRWMGGGMAECRWRLMGALLLSTLVTPSVAQPMQESELYSDGECQLQAPGSDLERHPRPGSEPLADQSLTDALDPCDGVLVPPPVGDEDLTIPPPATGETPVIPPDLLPEQPPQDG